MRVVIITGDGPEHHYVANTICAAYPVSAILLCDPPSRRSWQKVLRTSLSEFVDKAARSLFLRLIGDAARRERSLLAVLGPGASGFAQPNLVEGVGWPRAGQLARRVAELAPDIIAVYGTGIIPGEVLEQASAAALNMHTGLSPWYRGVQCAFWPIVEGRPDMVGATVHACTAKVDGGIIYSRRTATLVRGDNLHAVFARAVEVGAHAYVEVIDQAIHGSLIGEAQDHSIGREYRGSMLGLRAELRARWNLRRVSAGFALEGERGRLR
jgi:methionyl-tRNA formyltransferase